MKIATFVGAAAGVLLLIGLAIRTDLSGMLHALLSGGRELAWLLPYRSLFFALYALGWVILLRSIGSSRDVSFGYIFWVTSVREAVDRLLPVASIGGSFVGARLMRLRGLDSSAVGATIIMEIVLTLIASYLFAVIGFVLLAGVGTARQEYRGVFTTLLLSLPVPLAAIALLRYGSVFERLAGLIRKCSGLEVSARVAAQLDQQMRSMLRKRVNLSLAGALELLAVASGCFEIWFAMRLFGRPVTVVEAVILESLTVALRHVAFIVPAGIGVQEAGFVLFGRALGIDSEFALAVSMVKRAREFLWGIPCLISWQWMEGYRMTRTSPP